MGYDLTSDSGSALRFHAEPWAMLLNLAQAYGWKPRGTLAPEGTDPADWEGNYDSNDGQRVSADDARAMAEALSKALADPNRAEQELAISRAIEQAVREEEIKYFGLQGIIGPEEEALRVPEQVLREFITFLLEGSFRINGGLVAPDTPEAATPRWCRECGSHFLPGRIVCNHCGAIPEEGLFLRWSAGALIAATLLHALLSRPGVRGKGFIPETIKTTALILGLGYGLTKIWQKIRDMHRPVLDEAISVFSDRFGRVLLIVLVVAFAWYAVPILYLMVSGDGLTLSTAEPAWFTWFRKFRLVCFFFAGAFGVMAILRQGVRFFDPRVRSTYELRWVGGSSAADEEQRPDDQDSD